MQKLMLTVYDSKAEVYLSPSITPNAAVFARELGDGLRQNPDSPLARHPEDFAVYLIATFDDETGDISVLPSRRLLYEVKDLVSSS